MKVFRIVLYPAVLTAVVGIIVVGVLTMPQPQRPSGFALWGTIGLAVTIWGIILGGIAKTADVLRHWHWLGLVVMGVLAYLAVRLMNQALKDVFTWSGCGYIGLVIICLGEAVAILGLMIWRSLMIASEVEMMPEGAILSLK